ncbi:hypothetical protein [Cellulomonas sp. HZM]|uniref:hypothetical protein n=1 Tax=Cellulomonas sp. HZM TaxID=1454010 RepID=UPI0012DC51CD|nr:hypothetical protein [Cellulomonas sp. HZM]
MTPPKRHRNLVRGVLVTAAVAFLTGCTGNADAPPRSTASTALSAAYPSTDGGSSFGKKDDGSRYYETVLRGSGGHLTVTDVEWLGDDAHHPAVVHLARTSSADPYAVVGAKPEVPFDTKRGRTAALTLVFASDAMVPAGRVVVSYSTSAGTGELTLEPKWS